jgi:hypothetical protein
MGFGGQIGFGLKYVINRNLFVYTECPLQFISEQTTERSDVLQTGSPSVLPPQHDVQKTTALTTRFFIPATVYLIFRF